ncbi:MAG: CcdB family protein [Candidatus Anammoxibacter sp.]
MSQFTLYKNEDKNSQKIYPYFVDVQSNLLDDLNSRLVIPLSPYSAVNKTNAKKICPVIQLDEGKFVLLTHQMTTVPRATLKTVITSIENYRYEIIDAIDMLITGI